MRLIRAAERLPFPRTGISSTVTPPMVVVERMFLAGTLGWIRGAEMAVIRGNDYQPRHESQVPVANIFGARCCAKWLVTGKARVDGANVKGVTSPRRARQPRTFILRHLT